MQIRHGFGSLLSSLKGPCFYSSLNPQDHRYRPEIPDPAQVILAWGWIWGSSGFSRNQNNRGSSGACVTCMNHDLGVKTNKRKNAAWRAKIVNAFVLRLFLYVWCAKTWRPPNWAHDDTITRGDIGGLVSLVYICAQDSTSGRNMKANLRWKFTTHILGVKIESEKEVCQNMHLACSFEECHSTPSHT